MPERHVYRYRRWADHLLLLTFLGGIAVVAAIGILRDRPSAGAASASPMDGTATSATSAGASGSTTTTAVPTALDDRLVAAFDAARAGAADAGFTLTITDGFRTVAEQQALYDEEVRKRGSVEVASRWVFPPERSMHVRGLAVDVGDGPAADWLADHGSAWGLCQTLGWEWWHFEWRPRWAEARSCPGPVGDPEDAPGIDG